MELSKDEEYVREQLAAIHPQILINAEKVCGAGYKKWGHDLIACVVEIYLEKPVDYQLKVIADGKLENFLTKVMNFQLKLGTTRFYHHYRKQNEKSRELYVNHDYGGRMIIDSLAFVDSDDDLMLCIKSNIDKLNPFEKVLVTEHIIGGFNYKEMAEKYDIPYYTFKKGTKEVLEKLKTLCSHLR